MKVAIASGIVLLVLVAACSGGAGTASSPDVASPVGSTEPLPSANASPSSPSEPSATASATPEPSVSAACMDAATVDLIMNNLDKLKDLSPAQLAAIVATLRATNDPATADWREELAANIEAKDWYEAGLAGMSIASGQITLKKC